MLTPKIDFDSKTMQKVIQSIVKIEAFEHRFINMN